MSAWLRVAVMTAVLLATPCVPAKRVNPLWDTMWAYYNYSKGPSPIVDLNIRTWVHHNPGMRLVLINDSNILDYVPDLPDEYWRLPYHQCKSDFVRAAVIYHNGGLYMDCDFMMMQSIEPILENLETHDIVSYGDSGPTHLEKCGKQFSSNWHAGRRGNAFSQTWWVNTKRLLKRKCHTGDYDNGVELVCCHEEQAPDKHLKTPLDWAARYPEDDFGKAVQALPSGIRMFCLHGARTLTAHRNGELYWSPWDHIKQQTDDDGKWELKYRVLGCKETSVGDLQCGETHTPNGKVLPARDFENFFGRPAYHLFTSTSQIHKPWLSAETLLQHSWLISEMYRRSLGVAYTGHPAGSNFE